MGTRYCFNNKGFKNPLIIISQILQIKIFGNWPPSNRMSAADFMDLSAADIMDYSDAAWYDVGGESDMIFAQWLLDRCADLSDVATPESLEACERVLPWFRIRQRLRVELGLTCSETDADEPIRQPSWSVSAIVQEVGAISGDCVANSPIPVRRVGDFGESGCGRSGGDGHGAAHQSGGWRGRNGVVRVDGGTGGRVALEGQSQRCGSSRVRAGDGLREAVA